VERAARPGVAGHRIGDGERGQHRHRRGVERDCDCLGERASARRSVPSLRRSARKSGLAPLLLVVRRFGVALRRLSGRARHGGPLAQPRASSSGPAVSIPRQLRFCLIRAKCGFLPRQRRNFSAVMQRVNVRRQRRRRRTATTNRRPPTAAGPAISGERRSTMPPTPTDDACGCSGGANDDVEPSSRPAAVFPHRRRITRPPR
jgi:hypothetical protein